MSSRFSDTMSFCSIPRLAILGMYVPLNPIMTDVNAIFSITCLDRSSFLLAYVQENELGISAHRH
jgi:hypothetical protein